MTDISITIDETANGETVYCKELDAFLQIYIVPSGAILSEKQAAQDALDKAQKTIDALDAVTIKRDEALSAADQAVEIPLIP